MILNDIFIVKSLPLFMNPIYICKKIELDKDKIIFDLLQKVEILTQEIQQLNERLLKYEHPKNSNNSSIPPSKDENRPNRKSLREPTGKKQGGQKGRKGNTLKMTEHPDFVKEHKPYYCNCCGKNIDHIPTILFGKRQVVDIPPIKPLVTEHRLYGRICSCGHQTTSNYPSQANAPVSYGNNIEALIGYMHTRQYIPFKRMQELINDIFNIPISEGGIHYLLNKLVNKAKPAYQAIKNQLQMQTRFAVGADETGLRVAGENHWAWTWQNNEATFISITDNRGASSINQNFQNGFENAVLVHDCWKSHFNTTALSHQICIAHLLRDLNYLSELHAHKWSEVCKTLFKSALELERVMNKKGYQKCNVQRSMLEKRLDRLLNYPIDFKLKKLISFQKRLIRYRKFIYPFLYYPQVPPDNNASERAIRNIKVKQKVSGQFRSTNGAFNFAVLRSVVDTIIKNKQNVLNSLSIIANLQTD